MKGESNPLVYHTPYGLVLSVGAELQSPSICTFLTRRTETHRFKRVWYASICTLRQGIIIPFVDSPFIVWSPLPTSYLRFALRASRWACALYTLRSIRSAYLISSASACFLPRALRLLELAVLPPSEGALTTRTTYS